MQLKLQAHREKFQQEQAHIRLKKGACVRATARTGAKSRFMLTRISYHILCVLCCRKLQSIVNRISRVPRIPSIPPPCLASSLVTMLKA